MDSLVLAAEFIFTYVPLEDEEIVSVSLRASFNSWGEWPMEKQPDGAWSITVDLEPGEYQYKFFINSQWPKDMSTAHAGGPVDPNAIGYVNDGFGGQNAVCRVKEEITEGVILIHNPDDPAYLCIADDRLVVRLKTSTGQVASVQLVTDEGEWSMQRQLQWEYGEVYRLSLELPDSLKYHFSGTTFEGTKFSLPEDPSQSFIFDGIDRFPQLKWVSQSVIYQIFPERFYNGNPENDVLALKSDEFHYNELWAHNILWVKEGPALANWNDPQAYEAWWGVGSLPKLNTGNPGVKEYLFKVVRHWLAFGADGWRVDVPNELVEAKKFFNEMRQLAKMEKSDAYLIAEIWQLDSSWVQGNQFDSLMNYALGRDILLNFVKGNINGEDTLANLSRYFGTYGENVTAMGFNLVSSHDTGRIFTDLGGGNFGDSPNSKEVERLKLLSTLLYTMPGAPVIFQGDERGILGEKEFYDAQRYPIQWGIAD
jgi:hypothetical protein